MKREQEDADIKVYDFILDQRYRHDRYNNVDHVINKIVTRFNEKEKNDLPNITNL